MRSFRRERGQLFRTQSHTFGELFKIRFMNPISFLWWEKRILLTLTHDFFSFWYETKKRKSRFSVKISLVLKKKTFKWWDNRRKVVTIPGCVILLRLEEEAVSMYRVVWFYASSHTVIIFLYIFCGWRTDEQVLVIVVIQKN